ncbi:MAG: hypothetical protein UHO61_08310 [Acutalibacteraceae bacterium]|nr:hypothetical protein [Acutalibacteraceae bacterium]
MEWKNTKLILDEFGKQFIDAYRAGLDKKNANASKDLYNSLNFEVKIGKQSISLDILLNDYWKYLEYGCKGTETSYPDAYYPAHFPPTKAIEEWIKIKPVTPVQKNGKLPTQKQLAFLIARSINKKGIEPRFIFRDAVDDIWEQLKDALNEAIEKDVENNIKEINYLIF